MSNNKYFKIIITSIVIIIFIGLMGAVIYFTLKHVLSDEADVVENVVSRAEGNDEQDISKLTPSTEKIVENVNNETLNRKFGKIEIVWVNKNNKIINNPLEPILNDMTPIKFDDKKYEFVKTKADDEGWYDYINKKWANAIDSNGSYFVWIPRYAYKIIYYEDNSYTTPIGYCDARGVVKINKDNTLTLIEENNKGLKSIGNHYILQPAFMKDTATGYKNGGWDNNISGIWVAKYEMSMETNGVETVTESYNIGDVLISDDIKAVSKPGVTSWRNITIGNAFNNSYNYNRDMESHLLKNSEWGAIAYLTYSKYGRNGYEITLNKDQKYYTGGSKTLTEIYNYNGNQTSTGNPSGIFDLCGGAWEFVAAYINNGYKRLNLYGGIEENFLCENSERTTKYKTVYKNSDGDDGQKVYNRQFAYDNYEMNTEKRGDAIFETSTLGYGNNSWNTNSSFFAQQDAPFFTRGGDFASGTGSGIFSFNCVNGQSTAGHTYRVVLICER